MGNNLTLADIIGLVSFLISFGFNVYFAIVQYINKTRQSDLSNDLMTISNVICDISQSISLIDTTEPGRIVSQLRSQLQSLDSIVDGNLEKYQTKKGSLKFKFFKSKSEVNDAMLATIKKANKYVLTIGGRTRVAKYVEAIEGKLSSDEFRYVRLIAGDHIRDILYEHLTRLLGKKNIELKYLGEEDKYGGIIVTEKQVFIALKTNDTNLSYGILITDQNISGEYRSYIEKLSSSAPDLTKEICNNLLDRYILNLELEGKMEKSAQLRGKYPPLTNSSQGQAVAPPVSTTENSAI